MFMNALVMQGRVARLPYIFTLQTVEQSFNRLRDIDPLYWFLHDSRSFFDTTSVIGARARVLSPTAV